MPAATRVLLPALLLFFAASMPSPARASWPSNPAVNVRVCGAAGHQFYPAAVADGAGGAIVAWQDRRSGTNSDIYAQHVLAAGAADPAWPADGRALCTAAGDQSPPLVVPDGAGGAIVSWLDYRSGVSHVYAQHVLASGAVDPAWPVDGLALCTAANGQFFQQIVADGAGGAIVSWNDFRSGTNWDLYAQHVLASGTPDPAWPVDGSPLCTFADSPQSPTITTDGAGGAIVSWMDYRNGNTDIYAQHVRANGSSDPAWPAAGRALCTAPGGQSSPLTVTDGAGGAMVTWMDGRSGTETDLYAQHVLSSGVTDPGWAADGDAFCTTASDKNTMTMIPDGAGGAIISWLDYRGGTGADVYAQHVPASGTPDPLWPSNGRAVCAAAGNQAAPVIVSDGAGGAIVAWQDPRAGTGDDIYAQHVPVSGAADPAWPVDGRAVCTAIYNQTSPAIAADGVGGAIVAWMDTRNGVADGGPGYPQVPIDIDIYAQLVNSLGTLGDSRPGILWVHDVPADQGGKVRIRWRASNLDVLPTLGISLYGIWHRVTASAALAAARRGAPVLTSAAARRSAAPGTFLCSTFGARSIYWEGVGTVAARGDSEYTFLATTLQDSTGTSNPWSVFMVDAHAAYLPGFWDSAPDSGYSVDNLPPATPAPFTGVYAGGSATLQWNANVEPDLAGYRLYRGYTPGFATGPGSLVVAVGGTGYVDPAGRPAYYRLTAVDIHGNESPAAFVLPQGTTDVGGAALPQALAFAPPGPNPVRDAVALRFDLPREARVSLAVYDAAGARVSGLADGVRAAGAQAVVWDLANERGARVPAGLYFARLTVEGRTLVRRLAVLD